LDRFPGATHADVLCGDEEDIGRLRIRLGDAGSFALSKGRGGDARIEMGAVIGVPPKDGLPTLPADVAFLEQGAGVELNLPIVQWGWAGAASAVAHDTAPEQDAPEAEPQRQPEEIDRVIWSAGAVGVAPEGAVEQDRLTEAREALDSVAAAPEAEDDPDRRPFYDANGKFDGCAFLTSKGFSCFPGAKAGRYLLEGEGVSKAKLLAEVNKYRRRHGDDDLDLDDLA
jgi:hypothetical protein